MLWLCVLALLGEPRYAVEKGSDPTLSVGSKGQVTLRLVVRDERLFLPPDAPLLIELRGEGAVAVERSLLKREDAVDPKPGEKVRELAFRIAIAAPPGAGGEGVVRADLLFYVGNARWSREIREQVSWTVTVKRQ